MTLPVLHLVAGPNGAGKSTLYRTVLAPAMPGLPWLNADDVAADTGMDAYSAARHTADERERLVAARRSFATETVFSHPSKSAFVVAAARAGYLVHLRVVMVPPDKAVERVANRVAKGGHDVPEPKIRQRHERLWAHIAVAIPHTDHATVYDNSNPDRPFRTAATFHNGVPAGPANWPAWTPADLRTTDPRR